MLLMAACILFLSRGAQVHAAPNAPTIIQTDWMTGQIEVRYTGVTPGYTVRLYVRTYRDEGFYQFESWTAQDVEESHIVRFLENGQTVWFYITQVDPQTQEESLPSYTVRQTPPITAFIINWPEILIDLTGMIDTSNQWLIDRLEGIITPSDDAMERLIDAIDGLKDAIGVGQVGDVADQIRDNIDDVVRDMPGPIYQDDGQGTWTGGNNPGQMPYTPKPSTGSGITVTAPNPDSGTDAGLGIRIPYGIDTNGELLYFKFLTVEQLEKMKWLAVLRTLMEAAMWIMAGLAFIARFAPRFKV